MGQALYRKYRSKNLGEIVGQEHITSTLKNALKQGHISHAYLLTGPRGVGKTSIARILAYEINGLPYDEEATHLDIIEIDAASNRRIDEIRELRERVNNAPTSAKYKVYIIDEVHMLTKEAFNALLKTLEEPPAHAVFVLATTESHKIPDTIISRTQRFNFKPIERSAVVEHLRHIATKEKIDISDDALATIAEHGDGSFRDSISLLDQVSSYERKVEQSDIEALLGVPSSQALSELLDTLSSGSSAEVITRVMGLRESGYQAAHIATRLSKALREQLMSGGAVLPLEQLTQLLSALIDVPGSHDADTALIVALVDASPKSNKATPPPVEKPQSKPLAAVEKPPVVKNEPAKAEPAETLPEPKPEPVQITPKIEVTGDDASELWSAVLQTMKGRHNTLYGIARMAEARLDGSTLTLGFSFPFHQKRMSEDRNRVIVAGIVKEHSGQEFVIVCKALDKTGDDKTSPSKSAAKAPAANLDTISNIFGAVEMLE